MASRREVQHPNGYCLVGPWGCRVLGGPCTQRVLGQGPPRGSPVLVLVRHRWEVGPRGVLGLDPWGCLGTGMEGSAGVRLELSWG